MSAIAIVEVNLATVCVQSALYGVFFVLAVTALVVLTRRHMENPSQPSAGSKHKALSSLGLFQSPLFLATIILFFTVTANWCLIVYRAFQAFVHFQNGTNPIGFYSEVAQPTALTLNALPTVTVVTCDAMVIYRTWVIWNRKYWVVIMPICTTTALAVCSIMIVVIIGKTASTQTSALSPWLTSAYVLTFCNNFYGTGMISYRILSANRRLRAVTRISSGIRLRNTLGVLVESAALYASWTLFFFVTYVTKTTINALANDCFPPVSGIALMLITVRVGLGWAHTSESITNSGVNSSFLNNGFSRRVERFRNALPLHTISLNVSTTVEQETDFVIRRSVIDDKDSVNQSPAGSMKSARPLEG